MTIAETNHKPGPTEISVPQDEKTPGYIQQAKEILRGIVNKEIAPDALEEFLADPIIEDKLTSALDSLGGKSRLAVIRTEIEREKQTMDALRFSPAQPKRETTPVLNSAVETHQGPATVFQAGQTENAEASPFSRFRRSQQKREEVFSSRSYRRESPFGKIAVVIRPEEATLYFEGTQVVHLGNQAVVNIGTVRELLDAYPNLHTIQISKSHLRLMGSGIKIMLEERGINLQIGRVREAVCYDEVKSTEEYKANKMFFEEALKDSVKANLFEQMRKFNFPEAEIALMYFGEKRISMREIAEKLGTHQNCVEQGVEGLLCWMGKHYDSKDAQKRGRGLPQRIRILTRAAESQEAYGQLRERCKIGDQYPPETLPIERWTLWQKIMELRQKNQNVIDGLMKANSRHALSLAHFYRLDNIELGNTAGSFKTMDELAEIWGISHQQVANYKNKALKKLGLLED